MSTLVDLLVNTSNRNHNYSSTMIHWKILNKKKVKVSFSCSESGFVHRNSEQNSFKNVLEIDISVIWNKRKIWNEAIDTHVIISVS